MNRTSQLIPVVLMMLVVILLAVGGAGHSSAQDNPTPLPTLNAATPTAVGTPGFGDRVAAAGHTLGPEDAYLTIVMFAEFQCELCARYARDLEELRARYPDDIQLIWRHLPDTRNHDKASLALLILGLVGMILAWKKKLLIAPLIAVLVAITAAYLVFHPSTRYRSPADPFLFILSAYAITQLYNRFFERQVNA